jgi:hypothetical protein
MGFSGEHETDAHFCCRGRRSGSPTKGRPYRSENQLCGRRGTRSLDIATIPKARRAPNLRPPSGAGPNCSRQPFVYRKEGSSFRDAQPIASPWGIPEPRILQGAGNAASYFQQAASHCVWRGTGRPHCPTTRWSGGGYRAVEIAPHQANSQGRTVRWSSDRSRVLRSTAPVTAGCR